MNNHSRSFLKWFDVGGHECLALRLLHLRPQSFHSLCLLRFLICCWWCPFRLLCGLSLGEIFRWATCGASPADAKLCHSCFHKLFVLISFHTKRIRVVPIGGAIHALVSLHLMRKFWSAKFAGFLSLINVDIINKFPYGINRLFPNVILVFMMLFMSH